MTPKGRHVRYWSLADIADCIAQSAFGGKADIKKSIRGEYGGTGSKVPRTVPYTPEFVPVPYWPYRETRESDRWHANSCVPVLCARLHPSLGLAEFVAACVAGGPNRAKPY
jgi:hypothetical protein